MWVFFPSHTLPPDILNRIGWIGLDHYDQGIKLAEISFDYVRDGGKVFWPAEVPSATYITEAVKAYKDYFNKKGKKVNIDVVEVGMEPTTAGSRVMAYLHANPNIDADVTTGSIAGSTSVTSSIELKLKPGKPPIFALVNSPPAYQAIKSGRMPKGILYSKKLTAYQAMLDVFSVVKLGFSTSPSDRSKFHSHERKCR